MAYLHSRLNADEGRGNIRLSWGDVVPEVHLLGDGQDEIELIWVDNRTVGARVYLSVEETRDLIEKLSNALTESDGIGNGADDTTTVNDDDLYCAVCSGRITLVHNDVESWWVHELYPGPNHDAVLAEPKEVA